MSNFQLYKKAISATGTTTENEPIIKSDGAGNVMQWLSNNEASNITISEDGSNNLDLDVSSGTVTAAALDGTLGATTPASVVATTVATSNTVASPVTLSRTGSAVNASITYTTTGGSIYAGYGSAGLFAVNDSIDLTSTPAFTVNAATGATTTAGLATFAGNALISTASSPKLDVTSTGATVTNQVQADDASGYLGTSTNHPLSLRTNNAVRVTIPATGGIYEVNGVLKENLLTNSGFDVWSNSTLVSATTGAAPALEDAGDLVHANEANSGTAWTDATGATPPAGWAVVIAGTFTIDGSSGSGAEPGLKITHDGTTHNPMIAMDGGFTTVVGKLYKVSFRAKHGNPAETRVGIGSVYAGEQHKYFQFTNTSWADYSHVFEATTTTSHLYFSLATATTGQYSHFDSVMIHEVTPGIVTGTAAFDGWTKDSTLDIWRQHNDGGTNTKDGSFYALKGTAGAAWDWVEWQSSHSAKAEFIQQFAGRTITIGCWAKTSTASHLRIRIYDSPTGNTFSGYHTGGGAWEWLEVTATINATPTTISPITMYFDSSGATGYYSQPMLCFSSAIGEGNYSRPSGEIVTCEAAVGIVSNDTPAAADDGILNIEALSSGKIPKGCAGLFMNGEVQNSSITSDQGVRFGPTSANPRNLILYPVVNAVRQNAAAYVGCDSNGDIYQEVTEAGATLSALFLNTTAVKLR